MEYKVMEASVEDIGAITRIYNQGIEDRIATLETRLRTQEDMKAWLVSRNPRHKVLTAKKEGIVVGWVSLNLFNARECYSGVADFSIYVERSQRGRGIGKILLEEVEKAALQQGFHKLVLSTFKSNKLGRGLYASRGFREVGTYIMQAKLDDEWVDITIMEKILISNNP